MTGNKREALVGEGRRSQEPGALQGLPGTPPEALDFSQGFRRLRKKDGRIADFEETRDGLTLFDRPEAALGRCLVVAALRQKVALSGSTRSDGCGAPGGARRSRRLRRRATTRGEGAGPSVDELLSRFRDRLSAERKALADVGLGPAVVSSIIMDRVRRGSCTEAHFSDDQVHEAMARGRLRRPEAIRGLLLHRELKELRSSGMNVVDALTELTSRLGSPISSIQDEVERARGERTCDAAPLKRKSDPGGLAAGKKRSIGAMILSQVSGDGVRGKNPRTQLQTLIQRRKKAKKK